MLKKIVFVSVFILCFSVNSRAIPNLQIYIPGATYDTDIETWVIKSHTYQLWVIGAHLEIADVKFALAFPTDENGSIDVTWLNPGAPDYETGNISVPEPATMILLGSGLIGLLRLRKKKNKGLLSS